MKELTDINDNVKMMAMILGGISYMDQKYLLYVIRRDKEDANVFVSKLVLSSSGYVINSEFDNGEKEAIDKVIQRILSKENILSLENDGYHFLKNIELPFVNYFDSKLCYVATVSRNLIKECSNFYHLLDEDSFKRPVISVKDDKRVFNEGFVGNIFVILLGISILIFSIVILISYFSSR